jgi:hypothetical protein
MEVVNSGKETCSSGDFMGDWRMKFIHLEVIEGSKTS